MFFLLCPLNQLEALASAQTFTRLVTFVLQVDGAKRLSGCSQEQASTVSLVSKFESVSTSIWVRRFAGAVSAASYSCTCRILATMWP
ncbi:hypothetical protein B0H19DRAFT_1162883 [Mycena capillaripes]|nr:hypothetical protein B0H19DRAFT_1162883 [Mycena capillaripes]